MQTRRHLPLTVAISSGILACALVACAPPQVNLQRADLAKLTTTGLRIDMNLAIFNPNTYSVPLQSVGWDLDLFRADFSQGSVRLAQQIGANRNTGVKVPLGIRFASARASVQKFLAGQSIPWGIDGKCDFNTPIGPVFVQFAKDGLWKNPLKKQAGVEQHEDDLLVTESDLVAEPLIKISLKPIE